jgi:hypothetical protein
VMYNDPPRPVADRFWQFEQDCVETDDDGDCVRTAPVPHYYAVAEDGGLCEVGDGVLGLLAYRRLRRGAALKCYQLFGWHGGDGALTRDALGRQVVQGGPPDTVGGSW